MNADVELRVEQLRRFYWLAKIHNKSISAPYVDIDAYAWTKDRAVNKALRKFDRFMFRYERRETTREVRSIP